ncbi:hypothetical protein [Iriri virus]|uniref:Uncharacterized protein n=1 Tax=Iriri virus TaxID=1620893 RepID=A0A0D3R147_9RHAB|nr:hypothetical protein [Iriri virus]AJR28378.1 hypothetical protein [Iriri virus]
MIKIRKTQENRDEFSLYQRFGERLVSLFPDSFDFYIKREEGGTIALTLTWPPGLPVLIIPRRLKTSRRFIVYRPGRDLFVIANLLYNVMGLKKSQIDMRYEMINEGKWAIVTLYG